MPFLTKLFLPPIKLMPSELKALQSKSQKLLLYTGLIRTSTPGTYTIMPTLNKSLVKLSTLIEQAMSKIGGERIMMPVLGNKNLWDKAGRWSEMDNELFKLKDRNMKDLCLCPTHEEEVTEIVAMHNGLSYKQLPLKLYQITTKFRDEPVPKFGLLRAREFIMKDLYTFDASLELADKSYESVLTAYNNIFSSLEVPYLQVSATTGSIGGKKSHEFHILANIGEDNLSVCSKCSKGYNQDLQDGQNALKCEDSNCPLEFDKTKGIEVGHCFLLGDKYSSCFKANYNTESNEAIALQMGCYGIGVTRLLAASLEVLSTEDSIRWPKLLAPYKLAVLLQKKGAKDTLSPDVLDNLYKMLMREIPQEDILIDDRTNLTIGRKITDMDRLGIPFLIVAKKKECDDLEIIDTYKNNSFFLSPSEIPCFIRNHFELHSDSI